jgi:hypothetical protein
MIDEVRLGRLFFLLLWFWFCLLEIPKLRICQLARLYSTGRNRAGLLGAGAGVTNGIAKCRVSV